MTDTMPRCETCTWWRRHPKDVPEDDPVDGWGWCDHVHIGHNDHRRFPTRVPFIVRDTKYTDLATPNDFGCTLHEPKEPS
jgi:hypothetical protein